MASKLIKRGRLYRGAQLIAEVATATVRTMTNNEQGDGTDGSEYFSQGNARVEIDFETVKPAAGYSVSQLEDDVTNQTVGIDYTWVVGDRKYKSSGTMQSDEHKFEQKNGMLTGSFKFVGGPRTQV